MKVQREKQLHINFPSESANFLACCLANWPFLFRSQICSNQLQIEKIMDSWKTCLILRDIILLDKFEFFAGKNMLKSYGKDCLLCNMKR